MPLDPVLLGRQAHLAARERRRRRGRRATPGTLRLGTVDSFLCARLGARFETDPSTASRTQLGRARVGPRAARRLRRAAGGAAGDRRHGRRPRHAQPSRTGRSSCRCGRAASTSRRRSAGAGCVTPGLAKATYGTGVFLLAHAGDERPAPAGGLLPTVAWRVGGPGRVGDRRRRVHGRSAARVAQPRAGPRRRSRRRWRPRRPRSTTPRASASSRRSPASARRGGAQRPGR